MRVENISRGRVGGQHRFELFGQRTENYDTKTDLCVLSKRPTYKTIKLYMRLCDVNSLRPKLHLRFSCSLRLRNLLLSWRLFRHLMWSSSKLSLLLQHYFSSFLSVLFLRGFIPLHVFIARMGSLHKSWLKRQDQFGRIFDMHKWIQTERILWRNT